MMLGCGRWNTWPKSIEAIHCQRSPWVRTARSPSDMEPLPVPSQRENAVFHWQVPGRRQENNYDSASIRRCYANVRSS